MRYAFISDIHSNLQAWRAVHLDMRAGRIDYILCLGDLVGYGPSPAELLHEVHAHVDAFVMGNHDAAACGRMDDSSFNPHARELIRWTTTKLNRKAVKFLASLPLTIVGNGFHCVHGEFSNPSRFDYVLNPEDALPSWQAVNSPLLLAGHTHEPAFFLTGESGIPRQVPPQDFEIEPGKRYFINVGSVGCSRDGDPRACYCIYDTRAHAVFWRRIPFDLDSYRTTIIQAGLDPANSALLKLDPLAGMIPLRERLDFTPPTTPDKAAHPAVVSQDISSLHRSLRRWQRRFWIAVLAVALSATGLLWIWRDHGNYRERIGAAPPTLISPQFPVKTNLLPQLQIPSRPNRPIRGWQIDLGDARCQSVSVISLINSELAIQFESWENDTWLTLVGPSIHVTPGESWNLSGLFEKGTAYGGTTFMAVTLIHEGRRGMITNQHFVVKEPVLARTDGWMRVRQSFTIPPGGRSIQVRVQGKFRGLIRAKALTLERRPSEPIKSR